MYNGILITGRNAGGKSSVAKEISRRHDLPVYPSSNALIRNGALLEERFGNLLEHDVDHFAEVIIGHGNPDIQEVALPPDACYNFGCRLYEAFPPEAIADVHAYVAQAWFNGRPKIYEGVRYFKTVQRFQQQGVPIIVLEAPDDVLVERLVHRVGAFTDEAAAREFLAKDHIYGFEEIKGIAHAVYDSSQYSVKEIADQMLTDPLLRRTLRL